MKTMFSFAVSVLTAALLLSILPVYGEAQIYEDVLRLHVVADSDCPEDQALKLRVRDAVLSCLTERVENCTSYAEACAAVAGMQEEILGAAEETVRAEGKPCSVRVNLGREWYPRRTYGRAVLPAGEYPSLRVLLGSGQGRNWWCVLFPTVCVRFAEAEEDTYLAAGFTPEEYRMITGETGRIRVRFRILEILSSWLDVSADAADADKTPPV